METSRKSRPAKYPVIYAAIVLLIAFVSLSEAQTDKHEQWENGISHPWALPAAPEEELDVFKSRWKMIEEELKSTENEFAGTYCDGGSSGSCLRWSPKTGFVYVYVYEWLDVVDFSYGKVTLTPSGIILTVEREQTKIWNKQRLTTPRRWITAKWEQNDYVIPSDQISNFGNYVAGLERYNDFNGPCCEFTPFLVRKAKAISEGSYNQPAVPKEYKRFLKHPIEATIEYIGRKRMVKDYVSEGKLYGHLHLKASLTPVRINAGKTHGVKRWMLFRIVNSPYGQYLKITRVGLAFSEGVVVRDIDDNGKETFYDFDLKEEKTFPPVAIGMNVTTSPL